MSLTGSVPFSEARLAFFRRTYYHLALAILAFVFLEILFINFTPLPQLMIKMIVSTPYSWLLILGGFILAGWLARGFAAKSESISMQYLGLGLYVLAEAIIFIPILYIAAAYSSKQLIPTAGILTFCLFMALTIVAFTTRKDFSFLRGILVMGGFVALGLIVSSVIFGFNLGMWFSGAMILLASGAILYDTSKIIHSYPTDKHVAASLELFASIALLFWYILRLLMQLNRR
mgnify:CR=1 FL=1